MTLDVDGLRGFIETSLGDDELSLLLDAAYEAIDAYAGPGGSEDYPASLTELISGVSGDRLMLSRPAESVTSVAERVYGTDTDLAADDYELIGEQLLLRLSTGTNPRQAWCGRVRVTYLQLPDANTRDRVAMELVKLDTTFSPGLQSQRLGDWSETYETGGDDDIASKRQEILASLFVSSFVAK